MKSFWIFSWSRIAILVGVFYFASGMIAAKADFNPVVVCLAIELPGLAVLIFSGIRTFRSPEYLEKKDPIQRQAIASDVFSQYLLTAFVALIFMAVLALMSYKPH